MSESSGDVVVSASGSLNLTEWGVPSGEGYIIPNLNPSNATIMIGGAGQDSGASYVLIGSSPTNYSGPSTIGSGGIRDADSGSGDKFGLLLEFGPENFVLLVPVGYSSGQPLSGEMVFQDESISSLDVNLGSYTWSWGVGETADSITLDVVPEPSLGLLFGAGIWAWISIRVRNR